MGDADGRYSSGEICKTTLLIALARKLQQNVAFMLGIFAIVFLMRARRYPASGG